MFSKIFDSRKFPRNLLYLFLNAGQFQTNYWLGVKALQCVIWQTVLMRGSSGFGAEGLNTVWGNTARSLQVGLESSLGLSPLASFTQLVSKANFSFPFPSEPSGSVVEEKRNVQDFFSTVIKPERRNNNWFLSARWKSHGAGQSKHFSRKAARTTNGFYCATEWCRRYVYFTAPHEGRVRRTGDNVLWEETIKGKEWREGRRRTCVMKRDVCRLPAARPDWQGRWVCVCLQHRPTNLCCFH